MPTRSTVAAASVIVAVLGAVAALMAMLWTAAPTRRPHGATPAAAPLDTTRYASRGTVEGLPDARGNLLMIEHERIADWKNRDGAVVGMNAMVMPFPLAPGIELPPLNVGDRVVFEFGWDWSRQPPQILLRLERTGPEDRGTR